MAHFRRTVYPEKYITRKQICSPLSYINMNFKKLNILENQIQQCFLKEHRNTITKIGFILGLQVSPIIIEKAIFKQIYTLNAIPIKISKVLL